MKHKLVEGRARLYFLPVFVLLISFFLFSNANSPTDKFKKSTFSTFSTDSNTFFQDTTKRISVTKGNEILYIIYPYKVNADEFTQVSKEFQKEGFSLSFGQNYQNNELYELTITLNSPANKGSLTFNMQEVKDSKRVIFVKGDIRTGEVFVNAGTL